MTESRDMMILDCMREFERLREELEEKYPISVVDEALEGVAEEADTDE